MTTGRHAAGITPPTAGRLLALAVAALVACTSAPEARRPPSEDQAAAPPVYGYRIVNRFPHDRAAYTQGLVFRDGFLYESTGLNGQSSLRKVRLETGEVLQRHDVPSQYFAEGLTDWRGTLVQLTWQARRGFVYDIRTFELLRTFEVAGEGWGLTHDGRRLILSDGSDRLHFLDPETFAPSGAVSVRAGALPVDDLNELEWVAGQVLANVWQQDRIARIDPTTGRVVGWVDLTGLRPASTQGSADAVLNGIAWDPAGQRLFVTGKLWPTLFEITIEPRPPS